MLLKICKCGAVTTQGGHMCARCMALHASRHKRYNEQCRDKRAASFYVSKEWLVTRTVMLTIFDGMDIWVLYEDGKIQYANEVHHIEELGDNWQRRLDPFNLLPLSHNTHTKVTSLYKASRTSKTRAQNKIRELIARHFEEVGGIEKVLQQSPLVASLFSVEKTPH